MRTGGWRQEPLERGWYLEPTLLTTVAHEMSVAQEEIFGPVTVLIPFDDEEEAIRIANDSPTGSMSSTPRSCRPRPWCRSI